eukprot:scaffold71843_cov60-Phaeocystis_antarctica.AAC.3
MPSLTADSAVTGREATWPRDCGREPGREWRRRGRDACRPCSGGRSGSSSTSRSMASLRRARSAACSSAAAFCASSVSAPSIALKLCCVPAGGVCGEGGVCGAARRSGGGSSSTKLGACRADDAPQPMLAWVAAAWAPPPAVRAATSSNGKFSCIARPGIWQPPRIFFPRFCSERRTRPPLAEELVRRRPIAAEIAPRALPGRAPMCPYASRPPPPQKFRRGSSPPSSPPHSVLILANATVPH